MEKCSGTQRDTGSNLDTDRVDKSLSQLQHWKELEADHPIFVSGILRVVNEG
jgi:hypothetical protein